MSDRIELSDPQRTALLSQAEVSISDFLWDVQRYLNDYIKFADTKAAFTLAASTGLIGSLLASSVFDSLFRNNPGTWSKLQGLSCIGLALLIASVALGVSAIRPRLWSNAKPGLIFWDSIKRHGSAHKYLSALRSTSLAHIDEVLSEQTFVLASIAQRKYRLVGLSMLLASFGGSCAGIAIFILHACR